MLTQHKLVALIPARAGSKRVPDKNIKPLAGHPAIAYTITAALQSGIFTDVIVSTDSELYAEIARHYGAEVPFLRPEAMSGDFSPDFDWIENLLEELRSKGKCYEYFSILRPTSPFRMPSTILRAWEQFLSSGEVDSLRAVEKCKQHPGKMWIIRNNRMLPILPFSKDGQPWHSCQTQGLPEIFIQNASLEIAKVSVISQSRSISGEVVIPFLTQGYEGFDINRPEDWSEAEKLVSSGKAVLPAIGVCPYSLKGE